MENSKLDKARRKTLNAFPRRRFRLDKDILKFRVYIYGQEFWMDLNNVEKLTSGTIQQYIDEVEDDALTQMEKSLVDGFKGCLAEVLKREEEAR